MFKLALATVSFLVGANAIELTPDTWDEAVAGKTVFVKFFAPWCGHCKAMKPAWDSLMEEFEDSETVLVADVDCIGSGKPLCDNVGVKGFPTIKFGDPENLEAYKGGRDLATLLSFANELKPPCNPETFEHCDDEQKAAVKVMMKQSVNYLKDKISAHENDIEEIEQAFKEEVAKLQSKYNELQSQKANDLSKLTKSNKIGILKSVLALKESDKSEL